jgi:hypothetical protein
MMFFFWSKVTAILAILLAFSVSGMLFSLQVTIMQMFDEFLVVSAAPQFGRPRIHNLAGEYSSIEAPAATSTPAAGAVQAAPSDSGSVSFLLFDA